MFAKMDIPEDILLQYLWLLKQWWFWVGFVVGIIAYWYLFRQRSYKEINRKLVVRHGRLGKWLDIEEHMAIEHPKEKAILVNKAWVICPQCEQKHLLKVGMDAPIYWCGSTLCKLKAEDKVEYEMDKMEAKHGNG